MCLCVFMLEKHEDIDMNRQTGGPATSPSSTSYKDETDEALSFLLNKHKNTMVKKSHNLRIIYGYEYSTTHYLPIDRLFFPLRSFP